MREPFKLYNGDFYSVILGDLPASYSYFVGGVHFNKKTVVG